LASRTARFVEGIGLSTEYPDDGGLFAQGAAAGEEIAAAYEACDYNKAMRLVMGLADRANPYIENKEPWKLAKDPARRRELQDACTVALNLFRQLAVYLAPVLPKLAQQTGDLFGRPIAHWNESQTPLVGTAVGKFAHMIQRVDPEKVKAMIEDSKDSAAPTQPSEPPGATRRPDDSDAPLLAEPLAAQITIDDFAKVDLRVARVITAEDVPDAKKLLKLTVSLGGDHRRTVFAGIKEACKPADLVGKLVILAANLAPRQMKFGTSEGMICASGQGGKEVFLLSVAEGAQPGQRVH
jgi:methionyl-tRNA synthetase